MLKKAIHRYKENGKILNLSPEGRPSSGTGWIIIPVDIDRGEYIRKVYETGYCMIVTDANYPLREVAIPKHIIRELLFPLQTGDRGSLVSWVSTPKYDQVIIFGILQEPAGSSPYREGSLVDELDSSDTRVSRVMSIKDKSYTVSIISDEQDKGGFGVKVQGGDKTTSISFNLDGTADIKSDDILNIFSENEFNIKIASKEDEISTLKLTKAGILTYVDRYANEMTIKDGGFVWADAAGNDFTINSTGYHMKNNSESLITLMIDLLKMYMQTTVIDGKPLSPTSMNEALDLIRRFSTLIN
tara:strand:- start:76765 stop:77664 length:900 start_codon:yes stop_codon:yes gene_type:complete